MYARVSTTTTRLRNCLPAKRRTRRTPVMVTMATDAAATVRYYASTYVYGYDGQASSIWWWAVTEREREQHVCSARDDAMRHLCYEMCVCDTRAAPES